jgi:hypothetical protein
MLSEEALIVLAALGACGLVLLGIAELVWPSRPRHPPRRQSPIEPSAEAPASSPREPAAAAAAAPLTEPSDVTAAVRSPRRTGALAPPREATIVERCFELHRARCDAEAIALGTAALQSADEAVRPDDAHTTAALWSVMALARHGLGQDAEARTALESAIAAAPLAERPTYQAQLAALAEGVARRFLTEADKHPRPESEDRLVAIGRATTWAECAAAALPSDPGLASLAASGQAMLWPAYERTIVALVLRQEFRAARRLLREALGDSRFPADRVERFHELFSATFSGEIGQLTARAIRGVQEGREAEAVGVLQRVESLLQTLSDEALPAARRQEIGRRLSWGYHKLGERRVTAGEHEAALDPLYHALGYEADAHRRREITTLLVRGLEGVTDSRVLAIRAELKAGDREAAAADCDALWALLHGATDRGVARADLAGSFTKVQRLSESLGRR